MIIKEHLNKSEIIIKIINYGYCPVNGDGMHAITNFGNIKVVNIGNDRHNVKTIICNNNKLLNYTQINNIIKYKFTQSNISGVKIQLTQLMSDSELISNSEELCECSYCGREFKTENGCKYHENRYCKKKLKKQYKRSYNRKYTYEEIDEKSDEVVEQVMIQIIVMLIDILKVIIYDLQSHAE